jgi:peptide/nickel transport system ATP-binding protein
VTKEKLLEVSDLSISFHQKKSETPIVQGISFDLHPGEIMGVVGESGCGKTTSPLWL